MKVTNDRTLLERLVSPPAASFRKSGVDLQKLSDSIILHLRRMMNCRHGFTPALPDYGLPDLNECFFAFPDSLTYLKQSLQNSIEKYEPRLTRVRVRFVEEAENPLELHFEIQARLETTEEAVTFSFSTKMGSAGGIQVLE
jgi:type VI secretion system protein